MPNATTAEIISIVSVIISVLTLLGTFWYQRRDLKQRQEKLRMEWAEFKEKYSTPDLKMREWLNVIPPAKTVRNDDCVRYSGTPFRVGVPVCDEETFFGRDDLLKRLIENTDPGQMLSYSVLGARRSGKTSLLRRFENMLTIDEFPDVVPVYLDGQLPYSSPEVFYAYILREAAAGLHQRVRGLAKVPDLPLEAPFSRLEEFLETTKQAKLRFVFLLDEFEALSEGSNYDERLFSSLRSMIHLGDVAWVTASMRSVYQPGSETSPFGNILLNYLRLGPLSEKDAYRLLMQRSARAGSPFTERDAAFLMKTAGRMPYLLQMAGQSLYSRRDEGWLGETAYEPVCNDFMCNTQILFESLMNNLKTEEKAVLQAVAKNEAITGKEGVLSWLITYGFIEKKKGENQVLGQGLKGFLLGIKDGTSIPQN